MKNSRFVVYGEDQIKPRYRRIAGEEFGRSKLLVLERRADIPRSDVPYVYIGHNSNEGSTPLDGVILQAINLDIRGTLYQGVSRKVAEEILSVEEKPREGEVVDYDTFVKRMNSFLLKK